MDKTYTIERVRSDLRNEIYELMTHAGYHSLEKHLTESILATHSLYSDLRRYSLDPKVSLDEKTENKQLFAYTIFRAMNEALGGFHFDRFRSLSGGPVETTRLNHIVETFSFPQFLEDPSSYYYLKKEPDWVPFVESRQFRHLEDSITSSIKKNRVIPGVARAIGKDIVDALKLSEDYGYLRVPQVLHERLFDAPPTLTDYVSLMRIPLQCEGKRCRVLLKRASRNSLSFRLLSTNFGSLIRGD